MDREFRVMKALQNTAVRRRTRARRARALTAPCGMGLPMSSQVPVPKMYAFCNDASVLGVPFYVMEFVEGPFGPKSLDFFCSASGRRVASGLAACCTLGAQAAS